MQHECEGCGATCHFNRETDVVIPEPFPHYECPNCGFSIPALL